MIDSPYRIPAPLPQDPYLLAWKKLGRRQGIWPFVAYTLVLAVIPGACAVVSGSGFIMMVAALLIASIAALPMMAVIPSLFMCPSCKEPFFKNLALELGFSRNCQHCGIAIGTPKN